MADYALKDNATITVSVDITDLSLELYRADPSDPVPGQIRSRLKLTASIAGGFKKTVTIDGAVEDFMDAGQFTTWKQLTALVRDGLLASKFNAV